MKIILITLLSFLILSANVESEIITATGASAIQVQYLWICEIMRISKISNDFTKLVFAYFCKSPNSTTLTTKATSISTRTTLTTTSTSIKGKVNIFNLFEIPLRCPLSNVNF